MLDQTSTPIVGQLIRVHEQSNIENALELTEQVTKRGFDVGDFVIAYGHLAEILEIKESEYGNRSYYVRFLAEKMLPEVEEDWFLARYVQRLYTKSQAIQDLKKLGTEQGWPAELFEQMVNGPPKNLQNALRQSIVRLWPFLKASLQIQLK